MSLVWQICTPIQRFSDIFKVRTSGRGRFGTKFHTIYMYGLSNEILGVFSAFIGFIFD